jgi:hypothetical protein
MVRLHVENKIVEIVFRDRGGLGELRCIHSEKIAKYRIHRGKSQRHPAGTTQKPAPIRAQPPGM